jgi:hypothetical protein
MTRKTSIAWGLGLLTALLLALAAGLYAAPYWSMNRLKEAARERDIDALLAGVDQKALRQSVRLSLGFRFGESMQEAQAESGKPAADGARAISASQVDPLTERLTSPPLLIAMLLEGRPSQALLGGGFATPRLSAAQAGDADLGHWKTELRYLDSATVQVRSKEAPQQGGFILRRSGMVDWKLSGLLMPGQ